MVENWVSKFTTPYLHHVDISLSDFRLAISLGINYFKKMLIYTVLEHNPQKYTVPKLLRSKVNKSVVLSPKGDILPESLYYGYD